MTLRKEVSEMLEDSRTYLKKQEESYADTLTGLLTIYLENFPEEIVMKELAEFPIPMIFNLLGGIEAYEKNPILWEETDEGIKEYYTLKHSIEKEEVVNLIIKTARELNGTNEKNVSRMISINGIEILKYDLESTKCLDDRNANVYYLNTWIKKEFYMKLKKFIRKNLADILEYSVNYHYQSYETGLVKINKLADDIQLLR